MTPIAAASALLKDTIQKAVYSAVENFRNDTGISPSEIHIRMVETTNHSSTMKEFQVSHVELGFKL